jgi:hypothetical protein
MYTLSDVVELGTAHEVILSQLKHLFVLDDFVPNSMAVFIPPIPED